MSLRTVRALALFFCAAFAAPTFAWAENNVANELYASEFAEIHRRLDAMESWRAPMLESHKKHVPNYALLETRGCPGWIVGLDYLHWAVRNSSTQFGVTDIGGVQDRGAVGQVLDITPEYDAGFRLIAGRRIGDHGSSTEFVFRLTDFDQQLSNLHVGSLRATFVSADNSENNDSDDGANDITPDDRATQALANYDFSYNVYDLELAQTLLTTETLSIRVAGIGRAVDMEQDFRVRYTGGDFQVPFTAFETSDYVGGGILLGTDLVWQLRDVWELSFGVKGGALLGTYNTRTFIPDDEPGVPTDVTNSERRMSAVIEANLAINYQREVGRFLVDGTLGYEMTQLMDMNDRRVFTESHIEGQNAHLIGNIGIDGLFARMSLGY